MLSEISQVVRDKYPLCYFWSPHLQAFSRRPGSSWVLTGSTATPLWAASSARLGSSGSPPRKPGPSAPTPMHLAGGPVSVFSCTLPMLSSMYPLTHRCIHSLSPLCSDFQSSPCLTAEEQSCQLPCYHLGSVLSLLN